MFQENFGNVSIADLPQAQKRSEFYFVLKFQHTLCRNRCYMQLLIKLEVKLIQLIREPDNG